MVEDVKANMRNSLGRKADWNMALYDFERWAELMKAGASLAVDVRSGNLVSYTRFYAIECEMIDEWHGMMSDKVRDEFGDYQKKIDAMMRTTSTDRRGKTKISSDLPSLLLKLWRRCHDFKAEINMSVPMRRDISDEDRLRRALE